MQNNDQYNSFSLVKFVWKWRRWLLIIGLATAILSLLCTYLVAPRYKSTAVIYAPRTNSMSKILLNKENYNERLEVKAYALQEETEQMMQILNALEIKDSLISRSKGAETKLYKTLTNNLTFKRTEFGAISITVSDEDPQIACDMADYILSLVDTVKNRTERERAAAAYYALKRQVDSVNKEGTPFDFRTPKAVGKDIDADDEQIKNGNGYDHCFVLNKKEVGELSFAARLTDPKSGRTLETYTTEPGMQVYSDNWGSGNPIQLGCTAPRRSAICFECQHFPDSPNRPYFPSTVLKPGEKYTQKTIYKFGVE